MCCSTNVIVEGLTTKNAAGTKEDLKHLNHYFKFMFEFLPNKEKVQTLQSN